MPLFTLPQNPLYLPAIGRLQSSVHLFSKAQKRAIEMALVTGRPLLVRGEPGTGKSQLARAAAVALKRPFLRQVVNARTEFIDLLWDFDRVARLAEAQILGAAKGISRDQLAVRNFVTPGKLWWALNWQAAKSQHKGEPDLPKGITHDNGTVLLIDEIDKADTSVPSGLLSVLGEGIFRTPWGEDIARATGGQPPLVVITTNEDRMLPNAFVRRCLVLHIRLHKDEDKLVNWLMRRGRAHLTMLAKEASLAEELEQAPVSVALLRKLDDGLLESAAQQVYQMREQARQAGVCPPGLAEYIDLLKALARWKGPQESEELLRLLAPYALAKHEELIVEEQPGDEEPADAEEQPT